MSQPLDQSPGCQECGTTDGQGKVRGFEVSAGANRTLLHITIASG